MHEGSRFIQLELVERACSGGADGGAEAGASNLRRRTTLRVERGAVLRGSGDRGCCPRLVHDHPARRRAEARLREGDQRAVRVARAAFVLVDKGPERLCRDVFGALHAPASWSPPPWSPAPCVPASWPAASFSSPFRPAVLGPSLRPELQPARTGSMAMVERASERRVLLSEQSVHDVGDRQRSGPVANDVAGFAARCAGMAAPSRASHAVAQCASASTRKTDDRWPPGVRRLLLTSAR